MWNTLIAMNETTRREECLRDSVWIGSRKESPKTIHVLRMCHSSQTKTRITACYLQTISISGLLTFAPMSFLHLGISSDTGVLEP